MASATRCAASGARLVSSRGPKRGTLAAHIIEPGTMTNRILVLYGSYRSDRMGIRLAQFVIDNFRTRGEDVELIDAKAIGLPTLDRMYKEHPKGQAPAALEALAQKIRQADGF